MQGRCLCGAVTITTPENVAMNACHCGMCRRWGSSPYMSIHARVLIYPFLVPTKSAPS